MERRVVGCLWGRARRAAGGAAAAAPPRPGRVPASGWGCVRRARAARGPAGSRVCPRVAAGAASHVAWARPRLRGPPKRGSAGAGCLSGRARPPASVRIADRWRGGRCRDGWGRAASRGSWAGARRRATRGAGRRRVGTAPSRGGEVRSTGGGGSVFFFFPRGAALRSSPRRSRRRAGPGPGSRPSSRRARGRRGRRGRARLAARCRTFDDFVCGSPRGASCRPRRPRDRPRGAGGRAGSLAPEPRGGRAPGASPREKRPGAEWRAPGSLSKPTSFVWLPPVSCALQGPRFRFAAPR